MTLIDERPQAVGSDEIVKEPLRTVQTRLAEALADVLELDHVAATSHFFEDLGADSLGLVHFCARLGERDDLPSVSIKEVYEHPTIERLALAVASVTPDETDAPTAASSFETSQPAVAAEPIARVRYLLCGALQAVTLFALLLVVAVVAARGYVWIAAGAGLRDLYVRSAVFGGAFFLGASVLPVVLKWLLIGRWTPGQFRIWSFTYFRFWVVKRAVRSNPLVLFVGTPIYVFYLRALGAKVGRGAVVLSRQVPVCTDLLTIGDDAIIRKDSLFACYRAHAGSIQMGPVTLGSNSFVGESSVLDIGTSLGDGAQLGHSSALHPGQVIPAGEHRVGSPAKQQTTVDYRTLASTGRGTRRRAAYSLAQVFVLFALSLPFSISVPVGVADWLTSPAGLLDSTSWSFADPRFFSEVLVVSLVLFLGAQSIRLALALTIPRALNMAITAGTEYPLYGIRFAIHRTISGLTNLKFFTNLFGDSSYIVHYLHFLGYDVSFAEQTGANFGLNVKHDNPYNITIGAGTMAADGLSIVNADYSNTSFRVAPVAIGAHSYFGNNVVYPSQGTTGENCMHASKVMVPIEGATREGVGLLGSPSFEIPRTVSRDGRFDPRAMPATLQSHRLAEKNKHNVATMGLFLLTRWLVWFGRVVATLWAAHLYPDLGALGIVGAMAVILVVETAYYVVLERAATSFRRLRPVVCSLYDPDALTVERYWKLSWEPAIFNGTPFKPFVWRRLGVQMGQQVFDDGCIITERTMAAVGDHCTLNARTTIQSHSQEDFTYKSDDVTIGAGCTLGVGSLVHYGVTMGDGATLAADAFLMKGGSVPADTDWAENPARQVRDRRVSTAPSITARSLASIATPPTLAPMSVPVPVPARASSAPAAVPVPVRVHTAPAPTPPATHVRVPVPVAVRATSPSESVPAPLPQLAVEPSMPATKPRTRRRTVRVRRLAPPLPRRTLAPPLPTRTLAPPPPRITSTPAPPLTPVARRRPQRDGTPQMNGARDHDKPNRG